MNSQKEESKFSKSFKDSRKKEDDTMMVDEYLPLQEIPFECDKAVTDHNFEMVEKAMKRLNVIPAVPQRGLSAP